MKIIVIGKVAGKEQYREEADLGDGTLPKGGAQAPVLDAMDRIRKAYFNDHPFNPFDDNFENDDTWPDIMFCFESEYQ